MEPKTEAEHEDAVIHAAREVSLAWLRLAGATGRAIEVTRSAEQAGVAGARRLLPSCAGFIDGDAPGFFDSLREPVARGLITEDEAKRAVRQLD